MHRRYVTFLALALTCFIMGTQTAYAFSLQDVLRAARRGAQSVTDVGISLMMSTLGYSTDQWSLSGSSDTTAADDQLVKSNTYKDSSGNILTLQFCGNMNYNTTLQTVCTSAPNKCGMTGSGFITDHYDYYSGMVQKESHTPCSAQPPSDSLCPFACTPTIICHSDGNLYDSCTDALVQSCAAGCSAGVGRCNANTSTNTNNTCVSSNICAADGDVHDSCTGALVEACQYGCSAGQCVTGNTTVQGQCTSQYVCYADGSVHDSCTGALIQACQYGCANGSCNATCSSQNACQSDGNLHDSCTGAITTICRWGCSGSYCSNPPKGVISSFSVKPALVTSGAIDTAGWSVENVSVCTVTGTNSDQWSSTGDGHFSDQTSAIRGRRPTS